MRLLQTKLHAPPPRPGAVVRPRLDDRLALGVTSKLTLLSAPPGFGKSSLVGAWFAAHGTGVDAAWLSLDADDNEPATFWSYVIAALQLAAPNVGAEAAAALEAPSPQTEVALRLLLNDLADLADDVVLVLDDYHLIDRPEVHEGVASMLERLPPSAHVVIATRADPPLPLARLRARAELVEIRAADLRFTPEEAAAYLRGTMALDVSDAEVGALEARTEGWIAALQLAALSVQGRDDVASFIDSFAGDDRFVVDYLVDEVLARQPENVRSFLLQTSILDRLAASLCDAVTGREDGTRLLEALDRGNLFLVPLDDRRRWYRYHHLFADVLRARLVDEEPERIPDLHRRASDWFEAHDDRNEAIRHALDGRDFDRAATLIERATPDMQRARRETALRRWMAALPADVFDARPVLSIGYVGALMADGTTEGVEPHLARVERWLQANPGGGTRAYSTSDAGGMVVVDPTQARRLPGVVAMYRAALALTQGDLHGTSAYAQRAMDLADADDHLGRGAAAALKGLASWTSGDLEAAYQSYAEGMASLERAGHDADVIGGSITMADLRIVQGRLTNAQALYEHGLARATRAGEPPLRGAADMHVGIAGILLERGQLTEALDHLSSSRAMGEELGLPQHPWRWRAAAARIRQTEGDLDGALELIEAAEPVYTTDFSPNVRPIEAVKASVWIAQGNLDAARDWARKRGLTPTDDLTYLREYEHMTLMRLLLAQGSVPDRGGSLEEAIGLAERLRAAAEAGGRFGSVVEIAVMEALAHHAIGDRSRALDALERAVVVAEPEGHVRVFVVEGAPMTALLRLARKEGRSTPYVSRLLEAAVTPAAGPSRAALIEPLSNRELEVLRLLPSELDGPEIADRLFVSVNTVRTHTKNIYAKLGVNSRRAAVRRATELGLLPAEGHPSA